MENTKGGARHSVRAAEPSKTNQYEKNGAHGVTRPT